MMIRGVGIRIDHMGLRTSPILLSDIKDGVDFVNSFRKPGPVYVPASGSVVLLYTSTVALSYEIGALRGFIDNGELSAEIILGDEFPAGGDPTAVELSVLTTENTPGTRTNAIAVQGSLAFVNDFGSGAGTFGINCYEISDPSNPRLISTFNTGAPLNNTYRITARGGHVFTCANSRIGIYDVSNPAAPVLRSSTAIGSQIFDMDIEGSTLVATDTGGPLRVYDVSNPSAPRFQGSVAGSTAFCELRKDLVYCTLYAPQQLRIIDISDRTAPVVLSDTPVGMAGSALALDVDHERGYCYVAVEGAPGRIVIVDVNDPTSPTVVGSFEQSLGGNTNRVCVSGSRLYVGDSIPAGSGVLSVWDVSDPTNPTLETSLDIGDSVEYVQPWGPYVLCADRIAGNFVIVQTTMDSPTVQARHIEQFTAGAADVSGHLSVGENVDVGDSLVASRDVVANNQLVAQRGLVVASPTVPAASGDPGVPGQIAWDAQYLYWCIAPNSWVRTPNPGSVF